MPRLYIECSYLIDHNYLNTGIQRVVRKVVENMQEIAPARGYEPHLVSLREGYAREVTIEDLHPSSNANKLSLENLLPKIKAYLKNLYYHTRLWFSALIPWEPFQRFILAPRSSFGLNMLLYNYIYRPIVSIFKRGDISSVVVERDRFPMAVDRDDILLILDSSWYMNIWKAVDEFKAKGGMVEMVVYDLIPITHPQFCDDFLAHVFKEWIDDSSSRVDGYIAISKTVAESIKEYHKKRGISLDDKCYEYFYLGADFSNASLDGKVRDEIKKIFDSRDTFITVSTIEPRKNHSYILDAFEKLWDEGVDVNLLFIGRKGWKVEELMQRISLHPMKDKRLFYYDDIDDVELNYCYSRAKALIFASIVEGFGLPIIEGLLKGLPVLASNTKIHKEVGGDSVEYFDLDSIDSLVEIIKDFENRKKTNQIHSWMSWKESTQMLMDKIIKLSTECKKG